MSKETIKNKFKNGMIPDENDFGELIDFADSGTSSTEVVDARGEYTLLGNRLNAEFSKNNNLQSEIIKDLAIINPQHLSKWRNKRARMLDENIKAKISFWGDSITEGYFATYPLTLEAKRTKTFVGLLNQYYKNNVGDTGIGYAQTMVAGTTDETSEWTWDSGFTVRQDTFTRTSIRSGTIGSTATLPFNGTGIDIALIKARFYGNARIFIDDNLIKTVDLETATTEQEIHIESLRSLGDGDHTLKIEHLTGNYVSINLYLF